MKKLLYPIISLIVLALTACSSEYDKLLTDAGRAVKPESDEMLYATIEETGGGEAQTKVYADEDMLVLWNANDRISAFLNNTYNQPYQFKGKEGDNAGGFAKVQTGGGPATSTSLDHIYAVYPYEEATSISNSGILSVELPAEQHYLAHSFGKGANTMVSVTDDNMLRFKNAGGYLSFKFYGNGVSVKSITLKGNNQEKLAGKASVTMSVGGTPAVSMQNTATESVTLVCDEPVTLNASAENSTKFWFVIPPTTFTQGFTVTVTDVNGGVFTKTTPGSITVSRSNLSHMAPMEVVPASTSYESVDLGLPSGLKWATCNVGATSPEENGDSFAWGETTPKDDYSWSTYKWCNGSENTLTKYNTKDSYGTVDNKTVLDLSEDAAHANWGGNWRMPTEAEWTELTTSCTWTWTTKNGMYGQLVTGPNKNSIFLPSYTSDSSYRVYWSSSLTTYQPYSACSIMIYSGGVGGYNQRRCDGGNVRPVYDETGSVEIPDSNFKAYCVENFDTDKDGEISPEEAKAVTAIIVRTDNISSLKGVEAFTNLEMLYCWASSSSRGQLTSLDLSQNTALTVVDCRYNQLTSLDFSKNTELTNLVVDGNPLTSLNLDNNSKLNMLFCDENALQSLNLNQNSKLTYLSCSNNAISTLEISNASALQTINCSHNLLSVIDLTKNTELTELDISYNQLTSLDVSNNLKLSSLNCRSNPSLLELWLMEGQSIETLRYNSSVTTIKYRGINAVDLGLPSGLKWATCNVGASSPEEYGDYFAWGETKPYYTADHSQDNPCSNWVNGKTGYDWTSYGLANGAADKLTKYCNGFGDNGYTDMLEELQLEDDAAWAKWGENWRIPADEEWTELRTKCTWLWTTQNGKNGYLVTGPNGNSIFLPAAGERIQTNLSSPSRNGYYCSSSVYTDICFFAWGMGFNSGEVYRNYYSRCYGQSVRPVYRDPAVSVSSVSLDCTDVSLIVGKSTQLTATVFPSEAGERGVVWSSSDASVASVSKKGLVTANQVGNAVITVTTIDGGFQASCRVTVSLQPSYYVDLGLSVKWAAFNVGATSPEEPGFLYAWGETTPKETYTWETYIWCAGSENTLTKYCTSSEYGTIDNKTQLELSDDVAHVNWGEHWRMPTGAEWTELLNQCTWLWTTQGEQNGYLVTGPNGNSIFLPATKIIHGYYWSSSLCSSAYFPIFAQDVYFNASGDVTMSELRRYQGLSVRPVYEP